MGAAPKAPPADGWKQVALMLVDLFKQDIIHLDSTLSHEILAKIEPVRETLADESVPAKALVTVGMLDGIINAHNRSVQVQIDRILEQARGLTGDVTRFLEQASATDSDAGPAKELYEKLQQRIGSLEKVVREAPAARTRSVEPLDATDATTGLPKRAQGEIAIQAACDQPGWFIALFYVENMILTNSRFGHSVGDTVLLMSSQHLATNLMRGKDTLYRWDGPAFIALIERDSDAAAVAGEINRFAAIQVSQYFDLPYRTVYLPIRMSSETLEPSVLGVAETMDRIGRFMMKAASTSR